MDFICNALVSPEDKRDYIFVGSSDYIPDTLDYRSELQPIRNQGNQGTCYAQSAACIKEWQEFRDYGFKGQFSPQFFYNNRGNMYDDNENNDYGMYSRDVMKLLCTLGICREATYPYGRVEDKSKIPSIRNISSKKIKAMTNWTPKFDLLKGLNSLNKYFNKKNDSS